MPTENLAEYKWESKIFSFESRLETRYFLKKNLHIGLLKNVNLCRAKVTIKKCQYTNM